MEGRQPISNFYFSKSNPLKNPATHIKGFVLFYGLSVLGYILWMCLHHLMLSQIDPVLFINKLDFSKQFILLTGLPQTLVRDNHFALWMDGIFILLPLLLIFVVIYHSKFVPFLSAFVLVYNFIYCVSLSMLSTLSVEGFAAFYLVPILFLAPNQKYSEWLFRILRYGFILLFFSTAVWKLRAGGLFNGEQMSGILRLQHAGWLASDHPGAFTSFIRYLINHPTISYFLYLLGFLCEFVFLLGLFTIRKDFILLICFLAFLLMDLWLMRINYFSWLPFAGLLYFSKYLPPLHAAAAAGKDKPNPIR